MHTFEFRWTDFWVSLPEPAVIPRPKKVIGRRYNRHNSITPPLDFRSNTESRFDHLPRFNKVHGSSHCRTKPSVSMSGPDIVAES